jgi:hypothetical protein
MLVSKNPIQNFYSDISISVPIAMQKDASRGLKDTVHFDNPAP